MRCRYKNPIFSFVVGLAVLCIISSFLWHKQLGSIVWTTVEDGQRLDTESHQRQTMPSAYKGKELPFHQIYEPRHVSLSGYNYTIHNQSQGQSEEVKVILLATPWNGVWETINYYVLQDNDTSFKRHNCPNTNCIVTRDQKRSQEADAVIYHLLDLPKTFPKNRPQNQIWIAYVLEAPWLVKTNLSALNDVFNWTMSYREDSDVKVKYGFVGKHTGLSNVNHVNNSNRTPFNQKKNVVWFVSDCATPSKREAYVNELRKHIEVDVYGTCGSKKCYPAQSSFCYEDVLNRYKFYLSFENSLCKDYFAEKFFNVLQYDVVPVVYGGADYKTYGPPNGYVDATVFPDPEDLAAHLKKIAASETEYLKYLEWKGSYGSYLYPWMCYLCDKLHAPIVPTVKKDLKKWWVDEGQCRTWEKGKGFVKI